MTGRARTGHPSLFDGGMVRSSDPETSREAALSVRPTVSAHRERVLDLLTRAGRLGLTDFDLEAKTGVKQTSIGKRRGELAALGVVEPKLDESGRPVTRPAPSGRKSQVWVLAQYARVAAS